MNWVIWLIIWLVMWLIGYSFYWSIRKMYKEKRRLEDGKKGILDN